MLELHIDEAAETIVVTLTELAKLQDPYYLIVFTHVTTKQVVSIIRSDEDDQSNYPSRYNEYPIATSSLFANRPVGEWHYTAYEQSSSSNTDPSLTLRIVEEGKMILYPANGFEYKKYDEQTNFKTYNG